MQYGTRQEIRIGDNVLFKNGKLSGTIVHIVETESDVTAWVVVEEPGLKIETTELGWVYLPASLFLDWNYN